MLTDQNLILERAHPAGIGGVQKIYRFKSGYGLSLVNASMLHPYPFVWEAAVLENVDEDGESFSLTYNTELTSDVEVFHTEEDANNFIKLAADTL